MSILNQPMPLEYNHRVHSNCYLQNFQRVQSVSSQSVYCSTGNRHECLRNSTTEVFIPYPPSRRTLSTHQTTSIQLRTIRIPWRSTTNSITRREILSPYCTNTSRFFGSSFLEVAETRTHIHTPITSNYCTTVWKALQGWLPGSSLQPLQSPLMQAIKTDSRKKKEKALLFHTR